MNKITRTFRLNPKVADRIVLLQKIYTKKLGVKLSQADVVEKLVNAEYNSINKNIIDEVKE